MDEGTTTPIVYLFPIARKKVIRDINERIGAMVYYRLLHNSRTYKFSLLSSNLVRKGWIDGYPHDIHYLESHGNKYVTFTNHIHGQIDLEEHEAEYPVAFMRLDIKIDGRWTLRKRKQEIISTIRGTCETVLNRIDVKPYKNTEFIFGINLLSNKIPPPFISVNMKQFYSGNPKYFTISW